MKRTTYIAGLAGLLLVALVAIRVQTAGARDEVRPAMQGTVAPVEVCR